MYILTYYFMTFNNNYQCIVGDESGTASTLQTFMNYNTAYDGGPAIDPCGYDIYFEYDGTVSTGGVFYFLSDSAKSLLQYTVVTASLILI